MDEIDTERMSAALARANLLSETAIIWGLVATVILVVLAMIKGMLV